MHSWIPVFMVGAGGFLGAILRHLLSVAMQKYSLSFPHGTLWANLLGCLLLGAVITLADAGESLSPPTRLFLATGLCGGFTTMSTFTYETLQFVRDVDYLNAVGYMALTLVGCTAMFCLGALAARLLTR